MVNIYRLYEEMCQRAGVIDFAELLLRSLELVREHVTLHLLLILGFLAHLWKHCYEFDWERWAF